MSAPDGDRWRPRLVSLAGREIKEALESVPRWSATVGSKQLARAWQFGSKEEAASFVVLVLALCSERRMPPDHALFGLTVRLYLADPEARGLTPRLVELAQQISALTEPAAGNRSKLRTEPASHTLFTSHLVATYRTEQETHEP